MTRLPHENRNVKGLDKKSSPEFLQQCSHPFCSESRNLESHHIWRRSFLGGAYNHVELWDGTIVGNVVLLCREHHRLITENRDDIYWTGHGFYWDNADWMDVGSTLLSPQPEIIVSHSKPSDTPDEGTPYPTPGDAGEGIRIAPGTTYAVGGHEKYETPATVVHGGKTFHLIGDVASLIPKEGETCPTCERTVPVKKKREKPKNRVTYSFRVPKDKVEDGSDVLEELVVEVEKTLKPGEDPRPMYFTLCDALGLILVNKDVIL